jgi:hypothetical protein
VGCSGRGELAGLLPVVVFVVVEDRFQRVVAEVAAPDERFVVLFGEDGADQSDHRGPVGEDADDVGAAADLLV